MESVTIPKNIESRDDRDFEFLRSEGLQHIEDLSRKLWTDYNTHDPGITFLEVLCYATTDLGNRISLPVRDLLTEEKGSDVLLTGDFPTAKQILTTKPVTEADYRKLFIDIEDVNNAFIQINTDHTLYSHCLQKDEPSEDDPQGKLSYEADLTPDYKKADQFILQGLDNIYFEPVPDIRFLPDAEKAARLEAITAEIKDRFHANRNLCEDLAEVREIDYLEVLVCGDIEIETTADAAEVMVEILFGVQEYLAPSVPRYSLSQLQEEGVRIENIYDGPILENGFIKNEDLEKANIKKKVHLSDLIQIVSETAGVSKIQKLRMGRCNGKEIKQEELQKWTICFPPDHDKLLRLCIDKSITTTNLFKDVVPINTDPDIIKHKLADRIKKHTESLQLSYDDIPLEQGTYVDSGKYSTLQNDLPQLYGTGEYGLSPSLPAERRAKALQLKGYLLFFDQVLATYFGHLQNMGRLLSAGLDSSSYFNSAVDGVKDFDKLIKDSGKYAADVAEILNDLDDYDTRKNVFLDHLLARFAENMNDYVFLMLEAFGDDPGHAALWHKATLLKEYTAISYRRPCALNYYCEDCEPWDTYNVSGLQHRLARLLGIRDYSRRDLTSYNYEFYQEEDDDLSEWRWRIFDGEGNILLSSSMHYQNKLTAEEEMWVTVSLAWDKNNYRLLPTEEGDQFYFNLVDETEEVVVRYLQTYDSKEEAEADIDNIAAYIFDKVSDEGFYLFEHILFRPDSDDPNADDKFMEICMDTECVQCKPADPYSLRLTIVFPGWTQRFSNMYFRAFAEKLIRREVPAHILCRICWIGDTMDEGVEESEGGQMTELEELYKQWLTRKIQSPEDQKDNEFLKPLADLLHKLETVYPAGTLHDCSDTGDSGSSIILGRSTIGELKQQENGDD